MRSKEIAAMIKEGLFNSGVTFDRAQAEKLTKRARPTAKFPRKTIKMQMDSRLLLVEFQSHVNKQLHLKGLHLKAEEHTTSFRVLTRKQTAETVDYYNSVASGALNSAIALEAGRAKRK